MVVDWIWRIDNLVVVVNVISCSFLVKFEPFSIFIALGLFSLKYLWFAL